jgi:hypothetical protein
MITAPTPSGQARYSAVLTDLLRARQAESVRPIDFKGLH